MREAARDIRGLVRGALFVSLLAMMNTASAWDGSVTGVLNGADVTDGKRMRFGSTCKARLGSVEPVVPRGHT